MKLELFSITITINLLFIKDTPTHECTYIETKYLNAKQCKLAPIVIRHNILTIKLSNIKINKKNIHMYDRNSVKFNQIDMEYLLIYNYLQKLKQNK